MNLKKSILKAGLTASLLAATASPAFAAMEDLGTINPGEEGGALMLHSKRANQPAMNFADQIMFNISQSGPDGATAYFNFRVVNDKGTVTSNISNAFLNLVGPSAYSFALQNGVKTTLALAAGQYTANITGTADGRDGGSYNFLITAPTPEPEIWLSMAAGLGLAGFIARKRKAQADA